MRYIKKYKLFESNSISKEDINDILLELSDTGKAIIRHTEPHYGQEIFPLSRNAIIISFSGRLDWKSDIYDTIIRLVDYLGDNFKDLSFSLSNSQDEHINREDLDYIDSNTFKDNIERIIIRYKFDDNYSVITPEANIELKESKMNKEDIITIDDTLMPYKSYKAGHHSNDPDYLKRCDLYGRCVIQYNTNDFFGRGYTWFLKDCGVYEISIHKLEGGYFIINFLFRNTYLVKDLKSLIDLIKSKF